MGNQKRNFHEFCDCVDSSSQSSVPVAAPAPTPPSSSTSVPPSVSTSVSPPVPAAVRLGTVEPMDRIVKVRVGDKNSTENPARLFCLSEFLLRESSSYFRTTLMCCWRNAGRGSLDLWDDDPAAFDLFVHWLYAKRSERDANPSQPNLARVQVSVATAKPITDKASFRAYLNLYLFGSMYCIDDSMSAAVNIVRAYLCDTPRHEVHDIQDDYRRLGRGIKHEHDIEGEWIFSTDSRDESSMVTVLWDYFVQQRLGPNCNPGTPQEI
ncbi:hypothetical protein B0H63DRAFT_463335 [Podospora didyma]|uniref:BTB domain-containing protein n=1 Tax=Podospora didyma TaxID=330526 RepID=A0AAE0U3A3_9PEZI|nr:hypothetical protein B0H63DRAFT_463335 [Podospora didyma]